MNDKNKFKIVTFTSNNKTYKFKEPLQLKQTILENGDFCLSNDELVIFAVGNSWEECLSGIYEDLEFLWEIYALEIDDKLTEGAQRLKRKLLGMVDEV